MPYPPARCTWRRSGPAVQSRWCGRCLQTGSGGSANTTRLRGPNLDPHAPNPAPTRHRRRRHLRLNLLRRTWYEPAPTRAHITRSNCAPNERAPTHEDSARGLGTPRPGSCYAEYQWYTRVTRRPRVAQEAARVSQYGFTRDTVREGRRDGHGGGVHAVRCSAASQRGTRVAVGE